MTKKKSAAPAARHEKHAKISSIDFGERPGPEPYNASEIVALDDSRFLFCDNNISDALFELQLDGDGQMARPLVRRPLLGLEPGAADDLEGMALVECEGRRFIFATPSLSLKTRKKRARKKTKRGKPAPARSGLVRIEIAEDETLHAELLPDFRTWLVRQSPVLGKSPQYVPDDGGLNVEGLGWDPAERAILFGVRTPVVEGRPLILRVRLEQVDGPLAVENFEILPPVTLAVADERDEQGIRTIEYDPSRGTSLVVVGNSTSGSAAPFSMYAWDGNARGEVRRFEKVRFVRRMKVEGVTHGTIGGRGAIVFVDDGGGYQVLWDEDERLA